MIHIVIAEDSELERFALAAKISSFRGFDVLMQVSNGKDLLDRLNLADLMPDICILDIGMPVLNGYETLPLLKKKWPDIKVLVLTMYKEAYSINAMLKNGADGFLPKDEVNELYVALNSICETGYYYSNLVTKEMFEKIKKEKIACPVITHKEMEVIKYMCSDLCPSEIAQKLFISIGTFQKHRENLFRKLNVHSREGLIMFALNNELITR